jgi:hypothetical protein
MSTVWIVYTRWNKRCRWNHTTVCFDPETADLTGKALVSHLRQWYPETQASVKSFDNAASFPESYPCNTTELVTFEVE